MTAPRDARGNRLGTVQSLVRALDILDRLAALDGASLSEIARESGLPRSTAHRLLTTMHVLRYVAFDTLTSRWMVGPQVFALGAAFEHRRDLGRLGRPIMRSLMIEIGETVNFSIADAEGLACVGQARPANGQSAISPGADLPIHSTASAKVLLAHLEDDARDRFLAGHVPARGSMSAAGEKSRFAAELAHIRSGGFAIDDQENRVGLRCVAAPVFDCYGRVRASLSISGSVDRLADPTLSRLEEMLALAARRMTREIGSLLALAAR